MKRFLREYWMWIALPPALLLLAVAAALLFGGESAAPIDYVLY